MSKFNRSSIGFKFLMALSAIFLLFFLVFHLVVNFTSVFGKGELFNSIAGFMGTNPFVQFALQPVLFFGVIFHFVAGFILEIQNRKARGSNRYVINKPSKNSSWASRNMIISGAVILAFLGLHLYDFWFPTFKSHYIDHIEIDAYQTLLLRFKDPIRVVLYCLSFVLLAFHLDHGFQSVFQSIGVRHAKYLPCIKNISRGYAIFLPALYIFIAVFHYINQIP